MEDEEALYTERDSNHKDAGQRTIIESKTMRSYKTARKVVIAIFTLIVCKILVVRTLTLVAMPIMKKIATDHCSLNSTTTFDITVTVVYSSSSLYIRRLSVIMMIIITILQWFAHGYLFYNLYKFFGQKYQVLKQIHNWRPFFCRKRCKSALVTLFLCVLTIASILTITGDIVKLTTKEISLGCKYIPLYVHQIITYAYYATTHFTYILEVAERWLMVCFTASVGAMWHDGYEQCSQNGQPDATNEAQKAPKSAQDPPNQENSRSETPSQENGGQETPSEVSSREQTPSQANNGPETSNQASSGAETPSQASIELQTLSRQETPSQASGGPRTLNQANKTPHPTAKAQCDDAYAHEFKIIMDRIKPVYKIFRSFFVFQWLVHVYLLFTQIVHLLYPWIKDGTESFQTNDKISMILFLGALAAVIFYVFALLVIYVCGLKMNSYRRRFIRKAKLTQYQLLEHDRENKSIFTPRVPGTGLSISLESPGYMLGVVLTMFGLVGALLAM